MSYLLKNPTLGRPKMFQFSPYHAGIIRNIYNKYVEIDINDLLCNNCPMKKTISMKFQDCTKEVSVGDTFYYFETPVKIESIGSKFITVDSGDKWEIATGRRQSSRVTVQGFSTKEAYTQSRKDFAATEILKKFISSKKLLTSAQCLRVARALVNPNDKESTSLLYSLEMLDK